MQKLAIISTHPIQYNAPFFRILAERKEIEIKVFYTWSQSKEGIKYDPGFGKNIEWDIPLLEGYNYTFVENIAPNPGSHHFAGIQNPNLIKQIKNWGADAVLIYGWNFKSHLATLRYFKNKIPVFFRGDSTLLNETKGFKKIIRRFFLKYVYSFVDFAFYVGNANKDYFKAHGLAEEQLVFMPHAIDNKRFERNEKNAAEGVCIRDKLAINTEAIVFLFAGKLDKNKNVGFLINSFAALKVQNCFLLIAGTGTQEEELKKNACTHTNIKFLGFQNQKQMPGIYAAANIFVLPSISETWGLSMNEAMAAGLAIIASNGCGGALDLIKDGINGFVFKQKDINSLNNALSYLTDNNKELKRMGTASQKIIKKYSYNFDCMALENELKNIVI